MTPKQVEAQKKRWAEQDAAGIKSNGRTAFNEWLRRENKSQGLVARSLAVSQTTVFNWSCGRSRPELHFRDALAVLAGIPASAWELEEESEMRDEALRRIAEAS
jgi:transcriptional regulator with XRE-family HTH domain